MPFLLSFLNWFLFLPCLGALLPLLQLVVTFLGMYLTCFHPLFPSYHHLYLFKKIFVKVYSSKYHSSFVILSLCLISSSDFMNWKFMRSETTRVHILHWISKCEFVLTCSGDFCGVNRQFLSACHIWSSVSMCFCPLTVVSECVC